MAKLAAILCWTIIVLMCCATFTAARGGRQKRQVGGGGEGGGGGGRLVEKEKESLRLHRESLMREKRETAGGAGNGRGGRLERQKRQGDGSDRPGKLTEKEKDSLRLHRESLMREKREMGGGRGNGRGSGRSGGLTGLERRKRENHGRRREGLVEKEKESLRLHRESLMREKRETAGGAGNGRGGRLERQKRQDGKPCGAGKLVEKEKESLRLHRECLMREKREMGGGRGNGRGSGGSGGLTGLERRKRENHGGGRGGGRRKREAGRGRGMGQERMEMEGHRHRLDTLMREMKGGAGGGMRRGAGGMMGAWRAGHGLAGMNHVTHSMMATQRNPARLLSRQGIQDMQNFIRATRYHQMARGRPGIRGQGHGGEGEGHAQGHHRFSNVGRLDADRVDHVDAMRSHRFRGGRGPHQNWFPPGRTSPLRGGGAHADLTPRRFPGHHTRLGGVGHSFGAH